MKIVNSEVLIPEENILIVGNNIGMQKAFGKPPISAKQRPKQWMKLHLQKGRDTAWFTMDYGHIFMN